SPTRVPSTRCTPRCHTCTVLTPCITAMHDTPYWVPVSCMAVMQGVSTVHVWQRGVQRVLGTLVGLGLAWAILQVQPTLLSIGLAIVGLQIMVEVFIVRNYAVAVVFLTVLTIFLAESDATLLHNPNGLLLARGVDIGLGSALGAVGGWVLYHERLHALTARRLRWARMRLRRG
ncbi:MAG: FUSC family protein, partial [Hymenobacter sp.]